MYYLYILYSQSARKYYVGSSNDISRRLLEHNDVESSHYTKRHQPWKLVYAEKYVSKTFAIQRERYIKRMKSKKYIERLVEQSRL